ncbi:hypothetical protein DIS24_g2528 [Lasiodiplodia hormozganensis]|uniref:CFEM domain-containing protein n=1 Tax=Lasiodiplodia hormozganensis TaxID=869390 RepID=A0AA39YZE8_9PEZI|nr:hypothetical protein DIS24_g2528 [Lasiodiplodia hormozganensis]
MRLFWLLVLILSPLLALAQSNPLASVLEALPACGRTCLMYGVQQSECSPTNVTCICTDVALKKYVEGCAMAECTIKQALFTKNVTLSSCGAEHRDRTKHVSYIGVGGAIIALIAIVMRLLARLPALGGDFGWDDAVMLLTLPVMIPLSSLSVVLADSGLGKDMWTVTPKDITHILYIYYFDESLYITCLSLVKISICCFYLRIFPDRRFRIYVYIVIFFCASYAITFVTAVSLQCKPINLAWKHWDGEHHGSCISMNALGWSSAAANIALDIVVITLPLPQVLKLVLSARKKFHVMCMFSVGLFVTVVSMLRLKWMIQFANSQNVTWDYVPIGYWSTIEVHAGILCACLPAVRALVYKCFPRLRERGSSRSGKYGGGNSYFGNGMSGSRGGAIDTSTSIVQRVSKAGEEWVKLDEVESSERGYSTGGKMGSVSTIGEDGGYYGGKGGGGVADVGKPPGVMVSARCYHAI